MLPGEAVSGPPSLLDIQPGFIGEFAALDNFTQVGQYATLGKTSTMSLQIDELA